MPLITKASRRGKKPGWQKGVVAPTKEQRDAQAIVANNEKRFTRAFTRLLGQLVTPEMLKIIDKAIREEKSVEAIINRIPYFDPGRPETFDIWQRFAKSMESSYAAVIEDAKQNENRKRGWDLQTTVEKIELPQIPVNPSVLEFITLKALTRVVDISDKERERVREILTMGLENNASAKSMVKEIMRTVGLTKKQVQRLRRKLDKASEAGMPAEAVKQLEVTEALKIRKQRARAISRTETNEALSQGLQDSWREAEEQGLMPQGAQKEWAAMPYNPDRSSEICRDLNGQKVGINENFHSDVEGGFDGPGPPAHPNCRSTLILTFPE